MSGGRRPLVLGLVWGVAAAPCAAQQPALPRVPPLPPSIPQAERPAQPPAPAPPLTAAPFEAPMERLAELMGTLAFLRDLCGEGDGAAWHDKMQALIDAEGRTGPRVERLAGSYNRGFKGYQLAYRTCTPAARTIIDRSLDEGARIAGELSVRFGDE